MPDFGMGRGRVMICVEKTYHLTNSIYKCIIFEQIMVH